MSAPDDSRKLLGELGFTAYEADGLVTLLRSSPATASEVANRSDIPRSRVYDVMGDLADRGFVEVCEGEPREYRTVPRESITTALAGRYRNQIDDLEELLENIETAEPPDPDRCRVWSLRGRDQTVTRGQQLIDGAEETVIGVVSSELVEADCLDRLEAAADRGVDVTLLASGERLEWFADRLPSASVDEPPAWIPGDPLVRLLVVDDRACQVATRSQPSPTARPEIRSAVAAGQTNGFVIALGAALRAGLGDD